MTVPEEITVELMQQMLREVEEDPTIVVLPSLTVNMLNENLHGGSCISRVTVQYTRHGDRSPHPLSLIVKVVPKGTSLTSVVQESTAFPREIQMYEEVLPRMSTLLTRALPGRHTDFTARGYYTRRSPTYLIAVEDLDPKGFKPPKRKDGLDLNHCLITLRALARFHAASVMIHENDKDLLSVFDKYFFHEDCVEEAMKIMFGNIMNLVIKAVESRSDFGPGWADRLRRRHETLFDELHTVWERNDRGFNVLNHGDFGLHNVMFLQPEPSSSADLEAIVLVDFQCCSYNSPVLDLHQFIYGSASDDVRDNHADELLEEYHAELTATLESLGAPREHIISLEYLVGQFDRKMLHGFLYAICSLAFLKIDTDTNSDLTVDDVFSGSHYDMKKLQQILTDSFYSSLGKILPIFSDRQII